MNQIPFNEKKILKSLLNHTKTTTLRKAWEKTKEKPCKYKVGDIVEIVWTGEATLEFKKHCKPECVRTMGWCLGKVKITNIEKVEIGRYRYAPKYFYICKLPKSKVCYYYEGTNMTYEDLIGDLVKSEGFNNPEEMFEFLEKYSGGLETSKPFWLITWKWI